MSSRNVSAVIALATLTAWGAAVGCGHAAQSSPSAQAAQEEAVAIVDGVPVSRQELEAAVAAQIAKLDEQAYGIRRDQLEELITTRILTAEAKRRGTSLEALVADEVTKKVPAVTEADLDTFIAANRERMPADPAAIRGQIRGYLEEQRTTARRSAFVDELRGKSKVEVLLKPPPIFRASIDIDGAPIRGPKVAPVTIVEYSDFHCPYCRRVQPTLLQLLAKYPTQVRLIYKHLPLDNLHPQARKFAEASWCAGEQNRFWQFHDAVYAEANPMGVALSALAGKSGLDVAQFESCVASGKAASIVQAQANEGARHGVNGTPGFFINGRPLSGAVPYETFVRFIDEELAARP
jgi:predicted DsbA family dithiol-disulfide isomerase